MADSDQVSQEEADELTNHLQKLADQWRERLENPQVKAQIAAGVLQVSPLVRELLDAFPPRKKK